MNLKPVVALIAICLAMIWITYTGPNLSFDDANYLLFSHQMLSGTFHYMQSPFAYGYALPATVAASIFLFGSFIPFASSIPAMLEYIALILIIYFTCLKLSTIKIAFAVAVIAATSAFIAAYSSRILPDLFAGDLIGLAIYLLVYKDQFHELRAITSGLLTGALIFIKLSTLAIALPVAFILARGKYKSQVVYYLAAALFVIGIYLFTINFNTSIFSNYQYTQISLDHTNIYTNIETALVFVIPFLVVTSNHIYWQIFPLGLLFDFAIIGGYIAILKNELTYRRWLVVLWIGFMFLDFGSESLMYYIPITVVSRYFIILCVPMAILTARFLKGVNDFLRYRYKPLTADVVLVCLVLIAIIIQLPMLYYFHYYIPTYVGAPIQ